MNIHDVVDNESLIKICASAFAQEDIGEAKKLLFISTKTNQTIDPEQIPMFVAYDLHKLPPVCFDHVDVTKFLKDLLVLQSGVNAIKSDYEFFKKIQINNLE
ncbi:unnamed protein product [Leptidea sinapis]|uniref:Uncharacterized protein n=1 Tax=Leptidea sinapis TaxID=189913 RepID=A0A5E4PMR2_9NEOP|nr:unnamed protein product [Leptidea sinapis]